MSTRASRSMLLHVGMTSSVIDCRGGFGDCSGTTTASVASYRSRSLGEHVKRIQHTLDHENLNENGQFPSMINCEGGISYERGADE